MSVIRLIRDDFELISVSFGGLCNDCAGCHAQTVAPVDTGTAGSRLLTCKVTHKFLIIRFLDEKNALPLGSAFTLVAGRGLEPLTFGL